MVRIVRPTIPRSRVTPRIPRNKDPFDIFRQNPPSEVTNEFGEPLDRPQVSKRFQYKRPDLEDLISEPTPAPSPPTPSPSPLQRGPRERGRTKRKGRRMRIPRFHQDIPTPAPPYIPPRYDRPIPPWIPQPFPRIPPVRPYFPDLSPGRDPTPPPPIPKIEEERRKPSDEEYPTCSDNPLEQKLYNIPPCNTTNAQIQITTKRKVFQTSPFRRQSRFRNHSRKKSKLRQTNYTGYYFH